MGPAPWEEMMNKFDQSRPDLVKLKARTGLERLRKAPPKLKKRGR